ncbi:MAG: UV DNA damage repair endonuclease UvsE [Caldilineaceae bacterium]|nr:UV DNA damage repair endonuclease UvsE [Caldilineaceae bacterium]
MTASIPPNLPDRSATPPRRYRLGFPVSPLGESLRTHDSRRWQNQPHLSVSLAYLRDLFGYLQRQSIQFYRLSGQLAPYLTHPTLTAFHHQLDECWNELAATGDLARQQGLRLTMHPGYYIQLSSADETRVARSQQELMVCAALLTAMGLGDDAVVVIHIGGRYGEQQASLARFVRNFLALDPTVRQRLAVENDDRTFDLHDLLWVHRRTGVRLVLDVLHQRCLNRAGYSLPEALALALATWPVDQQPKIHYSSPRTELRYLYQNRQRRLAMPLANQHSDFIDPFTFLEFMAVAQTVAARPFDIMLEAKAKELALLRLREQIASFAPNLTAFVW